MQPDTHSSSAAPFIKFVVGPHLVTYTQRTKEVEEVGGSVRYGDFIPCCRVLMCVCTRQASVTYNWRVSGVDMGPDSVHPQHGLSAPVTGRICVSTSIFITGLTQRFGKMTG